MLSSKSFSALVVSIVLISCNDCKVLRHPINEKNKVPAELGNENADELNRIEEYSDDLIETNAPTFAVLTKPPSRAYECYLRTNYDCDIFESGRNPGTITGEVDFLDREESDGKIASAGNQLFNVLDQHSSGRWNPSQLKIREHNETHFATEIIWILKNKNSGVDYVNIFLSAGNYTSDQSIRKSSLNLVCSYKSDNPATVDEYSLRFDCYIKVEFIEALLHEVKGSGILLSTLKLHDDKYAFYQVADISLNEHATQISTYHGYVSDPPSRAKLCQMLINDNCGQIMYEPQSVEGYQDFPHARYSPPDGSIASGGNLLFKELDEYGKDRWFRVKFPDISCFNETHVSFNISWLFTAVHLTSNIQVYISNENFTSTEPLSRRHLDLNPVCTRVFPSRYPPEELTIQCPISLEKYRQLGKLEELLLLSVWNIGDTSSAFYQVMDLEGLSAEQSYENILKKCY